MRDSLRLLLLLGFASSASVFGAETIVSQFTRSQVRLVPLQKITVGPDDQYHGVVDPSGRQLVFTRKSDLVPHLCSQDLKSGEVKDLLPLTADSQEPAISPSGRIAFTYYKFNARGDICYRAPVSSLDSRVTCLKSDEGERSSPFWRSDGELGYVVRDLRTLQSQIVSENLSTGNKEVLAQGRVFSPALKPGGRYLVYNELVPTGNEGSFRRVLTLKDLKTSQPVAIRWDLPGISGFPSISDDEKTLFFSHYLNDTNHDAIIDGSDNSVIFRVPIESLRKGQVVFPEQLTSAESNCSFPRPQGDQLFVTCAFEGYLDVYQIPVSGIVPTSWPQPTLVSAHQTSRTYEERILILNTLRYRFPQGAPPMELEQRLLSNDILAEDTTAAKYYLGQLQVAAKREHRAEDQGYYQLLSLYLDALDRKKSQPNEDEVTPSFVGDIVAIDLQMAKAAGPDRFKRILRGLLQTFILDPKGGMGFLSGIRFDPAKNSSRWPLERYYYFELANWVLPRVGSLSNTASHKASLREAYRQMMTAPELSEESRLYYAFQFLRRLQMDYPRRRDRIAFLTEFDKGLPEYISQLLRAETATLKIIEAPDDKTKKAEYVALDQLMRATHTDYFLRKALYVRAIVNFADAAEFLYLNFVASNWLKYTSDKDTEFAYSRDVFINTTYDQAYDAFGKKDWHLSSDYFYGALSLTDDLESHSGYIVSMIRRNQRQIIDERYRNLINRHFIDDNMKFVQAILALIDAGDLAASQAKAQDFAIEKLQAMSQDRDSPVRYGLLGYCYLEKLRRQANAYDFDHDLFENAHRNLMLSYDIGRENARVKATALMNLGLLHQQVQNHGLAVQFFAKRKSLGFVTPEDAARFAWFYSRSLFYTHQADRSAAELAEVLKGGVPAGYKSPFLERRAFYLQNAGSYAEAGALYRDLFHDRAISGDLNEAKASLSYGYTLYKMGKGAEARAWLQQSLVHVDRLAVLPKGSSKESDGANRLVDFDPLRLKLDAYGLLGRVGSNAERLDALAHREALLPLAKKFYDDEPTMEIQTKLQMAELYNTSDPARAALKMREGLALTQKLGDSGQYLSHAVYQSTVNYLVHALLHAEQYRSDDVTPIQAVVRNSLQAYANQKSSQPVLEYQKLKLQMLWAAYSAKVAKSGKPSSDDIKRLLASSSVQSPELTKLAEVLAE